MEQVTCALVFSVVKRLRTDLAVHETWEAKASAQEPSVHFVPFLGSPCGIGTQNKPALWGYKGA